MVRSEMPARARRGASGGSARERSCALRHGCDPRTSAPVASTPLPGDAIEAGRAGAAIAKRRRGPHASPAPYPALLPALNGGASASAVFR